MARSRSLASVALQHRQATYYLLDVPWIAAPKRALEVCMYVDQAHKAEHTHQGMNVDSLFVVAEWWLVPYNELIAYSQTVVLFPEH